MSETVRYETDGAVGVITLNRPDALNAMSGELLDALVQRGQEAAADEAVRCVVVTGAGRAFCSGGDLKGIGSGDELDPLGGTAQLRRFEDISRLLAEMPKPTIAAVNGAAAGAGFSLALAADIRLAGASSRFVTAFGRVGLTGDFGGSWQLERIVGVAKAKELYLLGSQIDAATALRLGIVNRVVADGALRDEAMALAGKLAAGPTAAYARMKRNFAYGSTHTFAETLTFEAGNMIAASKTEDFKNAAAAFLERREPEFQGR
ncbi:MAG: enoyl-CoA hydratase-related protein [Chloroflexi bacterium]|nr:enoyl-CoA hydratase-related protein [Chloroflexota bacterium]